MMNDFEALIQSLGEHSVAYLKSADVRLVRIFADEMSLSAHIEICLSDPSWDAQARAIDKMIEIRSMFVDDVSIDYVFIDDDECGVTSESSSRASDFVAA